jgi:hypothetical protein
LPDHQRTGVNSDYGARRQVPKVQSSGCPPAKQGAGHHAGSLVMVLILIATPRSPGIFTGAEPRYRSRHRAWDQAYRPAEVARPREVWIGVGLDVAKFDEAAHGIRQTRIWRNRGCCRAMPCFTRHYSFPYKPPLLSWRQPGTERKAAAIRKPAGARPGRTRIKYKYGRTQQE